MDRDTLLSRFEAEYQAPNSITARRRVEQAQVLCRLGDTIGHPLDELTSADLSSFIGTELGRGVHPNTVRKYLGMVRSFVTWLDQAGLIDDGRTHQLQSVRNPRGSTSKSKPRPYKAHEIHAFKALLAEKYPLLPRHGRGSLAMRNFLAGRTPRLRKHLWRHARRLQFEAQTALALEQGLRCIEIHSLTIAAMHYDNSQVIVLTAKQGPGSNVRRSIPYASHARDCVQAWLDFRFLLKPPHSHPWLMLDYVSDLDAQIAPQTYWAQRRSLHRAFGSPWEWHRFRHTAATEWLRSGVLLEKVQRFMGHATIEQTLQYTEILDSDMEEAFGRAEADFAQRLGLAA